MPWKWINTVQSLNKIASNFLKIRFILYILLVTNYNDFNMIFILKEILCAGMVRLLNNFLRELCLILFFNKIQYFFTFWIFSSEYLKSLALETQRKIKLWLKFPSLWGQTGNKEKHLHHNIQTQAVYKHWIWLPYWHECTANNICYYNCYSNNTVLAHFSQFFSFFHLLSIT